MKPTWEDKASVVKLWRGDALDVLPTLADSSVSLIATDPPYFRVKGEAWDNQWAKPGAFLSWLGVFLDEFQRILAPNGSLYLFASPQMAWGVEGEIRKRFAILTNIRWRKDSGWSKRQDKDELRAPFPQSETILFAEHFNADNAAKGEAGYVGKCDELRGFVFEPLRAYLEGERVAAGIDKADCNVACGFSHSPGGMASRHYFSRSQWCLPTEEHYAALRVLFNTNGDAHLRREYAHLRREYEDLRREYAHLRREYEDLRRPFNARADAPYTDVWDFPTVAKYPGKHPCEKPLAMMEHIVELSSRPGDVVLDCFAGGCTTGQAAKKHGRQFIGVEQAEQYFASSVRRIQRQEQDERQPTLFDLKPEPPTQEELFS